MEHSGAAGLADVEALSVLGDRTRRQLYEFVAQSNLPVSRDECGQGTEIDRSLAAYHLDKLVEHGLLEASYARPASRTGPGAGRPAKLYRRALDARPSYPLAHFHLGRLYANQSRYALAIQEFEKSLEPAGAETAAYLYALAATNARATRRQSAQAARCRSSPRRDGGPAQRESSG